MNETENKSSNFGSAFWVIIILSACLAAFVSLPNYIGYFHVSVASPCINNLRQIDSAINEWALEHHATNGSSVSMDDIKPYIKLNSAGNIPSCPDGGKYTLRKVGDVPQVTCSLSTATPAHVLP